MKKFICLIILFMSLLIITSCTDVTTFSKSEILVAAYKNYGLVDFYSWDTRIEKNPLTLINADNIESVLNKSVPLASPGSHAFLDHLYYVAIGSTFQKEYKLLIYNYRGKSVKSVDELISVADYPFDFNFDDIFELIASLKNELYQDVINENMIKYQVMSDALYQNALQLRSKSNNSILALSNSDCLQIEVHKKSNKLRIELYQIDLFDNSSAMLYSSDEDIVVKRQTMTLESLEEQYDCNFSYEIRENNDYNQLIYLLDFKASPKIVYSNFVLQYFVSYQDNNNNDYNYKGSYSNTFKGTDNTIYNYFQFERTHDLDGLLKSYGWYRVSGDIYIQEGVNDE